MSAETLDWLNENTLIGFTDKRGKAWHHREGSDNHYAGEVPVEDVRSRLFNWEAIEVPVEWTIGERTYVSETDKVIARSDTGAKLGVFTNGYRPHQYDEWLISNVENILDDELHIGSAGLLKGGAVAWVSVEVPENVITPEGVEFRPNLIACTSFNGSISTTYKRIATNVVCDNTMTMALGEEGQQLKIRHSKNSMAKIKDAREALSIVYSITDEFSEMVKQLSNITVDDAKFEEYVDAVTPLPGADESKRKITMAETKRDKLWALWTSDERVTPFRGTGYGVWQTMNTYNQHEAIVRNALRQERNQLNTLLDKTLEQDRTTLDDLFALTTAA